MAAVKTTKTTASVTKFLDAIEDPVRRADCREVAKMMEKATGTKGALWGTSIVGFGSYRYASGKQENEWPLVGFSPRKGDLTLYILPGFEGNALMAKLGKHKTGKSCLYLKGLADVDLLVLEKLIVESVAVMRAKYPA